VFNLILPLFTVYAQIQEWDQASKGGPSCVVDGVPTLKCLEIVFGNILYMASFFIIIVLFIMFVVGSFKYLTSFGNAEAIKKAQGTLKYALIGFILFVSAFLIMTIIQTLFLPKVDPNNPGRTPNLFEFNWESKNFN
jgi:membrane protease YdiL (CAAX protease family)